MLLEPTVQLPNCRLSILTNTSVSHKLCLLLTNDPVYNPEREFDDIKHILCMGLQDKITALCGRIVILICQGEYAQFIAHCLLNIIPPLFGW